MLILGVLGSNSIPDYSDAIVWIDGTISGNNFVDKISGRLFPITNKDFDSTWVNGIPYKSKATISAPVGDSTLIAADVNNFWYTEGTPNQIPVTSMFQNIDYGNKFYFKHETQCVDVNGVETCEPKVSAWVIYNTASNNSNRDSYFGTPTKASSKKWVSTTGSNSNDGSENSPWLTLSYAASHITSGDTVYVKTGTYNESALTLSIACTFVSIGNVSITTSATRVLTTNANVTIKGFTLNGSNTYQTAVRNVNGTTTLQKCYITNLSTGGYKIDGGTSGKEVNMTNCVFNFTGGTAFLNKIQTVIDTCLFTGSSTYYLYNTNGSASNITIKNNNFSGTSTYDIYFGNGYTNNIYGNKHTTLCTSWIYSSNTDVSTINNTYNRYIGYTTSNCIYINGANVTANINYNTFTISSSQTANSGVIILSNTPSCNANNNNIIDSRTSNSLDIKIVSTGTTMGVCNTNYNFISCPSTSGYGIIFGADATSSGDDKITPIANGNYILGAKYHNPSLAQTNNLVHNIFFGFNKDFTAKYNYINGGGLSIIGKADGTVNTTAIMAYNVVVNSYQGYRTKGAKGVKVYNNSYFSNTADTVLPLYFDRNNNPSDNIDVRNNVVVVRNATGGYAWFIDDSSISYFNYNCILTNQTFARINASNQTYVQVVSLGYNTNGINQDPLYNNENSLQLWLQPTSPAIGIGIATSYTDGLDYTTDWVNKNIINKAQLVNFDMGAYVH